MKYRQSIPMIAVTGALAGSLVAIPWQLSASAAQEQAANIVIPKLSETAKKGKVAFERTCAQCHGMHATGTDKGPPLVHNIYNPGHHGDAAFYRAVKNGSPQHHWRFGDMPPQPQVTNRQIANIVRYVRELQRANGITYRPHRM